MTDTPAVLKRESLPTFNKVTKATADDKQRIAGPPEANRIPFGLIDINDDNVRDAIATDIESLADSIRRNGLLQPIGIRRRDDAEGRWLVEVGHRRYLALHALGLTKDDPVPVNPLSEEPGSTRTIRQLVENVEREDMSPMDEAHTIARLQTVYGMTHSEIAEQLGGWNRKTVALRLALLELPEPYRVDVHKGLLPIEGAQEIGLLIKDGAPQSIWQPLLDNHANYQQVQAQKTRWRSIKAVEGMTAALESRGFAVVHHLSHVPTRSGYEARYRDVLEMSKPSHTKGLQPDRVKTIKETSGDKRPILIVSRDAEGAKVWTVTTTKVQPPNRPGIDGPAGWEVKQGVRAVLTETRMNRAEALVHGPGGDLANLPALRMAASLALSGFPVHRADELVRLVGQPTIDKPDADPEDHPRRRVDWRATVNSWVAAADTLAKVRRLVWAVALADTASKLSEFDGQNEPADRLHHVAACQEAGMGDVLGADDLAAVEAKVRGKLAAGDPLTVNGVEAKATGLDEPAAADNAGEDDA